MKEVCFSGFSGNVFSETEMEAAKQLVQLSEEDDTLSCSSGNGWSVSGYDGCEGRGEDDDYTKKQEDVVSSMVVTDHLVGNKRNSGVWRSNENVTNGKSILKTKTRIHKKKEKIRSLASIYRATKEMTRG